ncbi:unnamed protein product [Pocillopora meandrina]|uniref:G-protein coupled receptors family 1 profile domain-containing protein n=1 Tax=Pocillopora meandrina TaxID=46732 RepID=A0AAU9XH32_9CNID|nr:unnamed protein product [Pocillopora meandrina]
METWFWILGWSLSIVTISGNGSIIFIVCSRRRLRTKTNAFIVSLAVADFFVGVTTFPSLFFCPEEGDCNRLSNDLRNLFPFASVVNLCTLVLERYRPLFEIFISLNIFFLAFLPCCGLVFCFASMLIVVNKHERAARVLAKQLHFNHRFLFKIQEKSAVKMMAIVIGVFLLANTFALRCGFILIFKTGKTCDDEEYKIPLLVLNSAINPIAYAFYKRDIKKEMKKCIFCVI